MQARHDKALGEEEKDAQRAALVQKQRQEKIDRENAQREAKRAADFRETMQYIQQQCAGNVAREKVRAQNPKLRERATSVRDKGMVRPLRIRALYLCG